MLRSFHFTGGIYPPVRERKRFSHIKLIYLFLQWEICDCINTELYLYVFYYEE